MLHEKIPYWARNLVSTAQKVDISTENNKYPVFIDNFIQKSTHLSGLRLQSKTNTFRQHQNRCLFNLVPASHLGLMRYRNRCLNKKRHIERGGLLATTGLFIACCLSLNPWQFWHQPPSVPPLPIGGVLPNLTMPVPKVWPTLDRLPHQPFANTAKYPHRLNASAMQGFCHPLQGLGFLSQGTGRGTHQGRMEYAYDFGTPIGTPVYAMQSGRVLGVRDIYTDKGGRRGNAEKFNFVWLEHTNTGVRSAYIHLQQNFRQKISIKPNDWVKTGQLIGYSGNSGWSSAPHLHVEVHNISHAGFGQTLPFIIASKCSNNSVASSS